MAALDFSDITAMSALAEALAGSAPTDSDSMLEQSAGTHDGTTVYRPYYVAARVLARQPNTRRLRSARGTQFDRPSATITGLMRQQAAEDERHAREHRDWSIPAGHEAPSARSTVTF